MFFKSLFKFFTLTTILNFLSYLKVTSPKFISVFGIFIFFLILFQCVSGIMLAMSLINDPMLIPTSRDEEDSDDLYTDDFFLAHERGVDFIYLFLIFHFLRKLYLTCYTKNQEVSWKNGVFLFLFLHVTIFFGLVLCCTHLSDITLTIASNVINTLTFKFGKLYWFLFTDQTLNIDTIIRAMYLHYILGLICLLFGFIHSDSMHYAFKDKSQNSGLDVEFYWFKDILLFEIGKLIDIMSSIYFLFFILYLSYAESLSYEIFMWGDIGINIDVRFLGVAPHWYFRGYMGWLLLCPHHYFGIFGLLFILLVIYFQPNLKNFKNNLVEFSIIHISSFFIFIFSIFYCCSFLPYGRFYNSVGGNIGLVISYIYILIYFTVDFSKYSIFISSFYVNTGKSRIFIRVFWFILGMIVNNLRFIFWFIDWFTEVLTNLFFYLVLQPIEAIWLEFTNFFFRKISYYRSQYWFVIKRHLRWYFLFHKSAALLRFIHKYSLIIFGIMSKKIKARILKSIIYKKLCIIKYYLVSIKNAIDFFLSCLELYIRNEVELFIYILTWKCKYDRKIDRIGRYILLFTIFIIAYYPLAWVMYIIKCIVLFILICFMYFIFFIVSSLVSLIINLLLELLYLLILVLNFILSLFSISILKFGFMFL